METTRPPPRALEIYTSFSNLFPARGWKHEDVLFNQITILQPFSNLFPARGWKLYIALVFFFFFTLLSQTFSPQGDGNEKYLPYLDPLELSQTFSPQGDGNIGPAIAANLKRPAFSNLFPARG